MKKLKILRLMGQNDKGCPVIDKHEKPIGSITDYNYRVAYGIPWDKNWFWYWDVLDAHNKQYDPQLQAVYKEIAELAKEHDILYHMVGDMMHPNFIKTLSKRFGGPIYTIYNVDGEPASSKLLSHPVVHAYDFALTCSKYYDETRRCTELLLENGAYGADWVACGTKYLDDHWAWDIPIDNPEKDIDVIFLGAGMDFQTSSIPYPPNKYKAVEYLRSKGLKVHCEPWQGLDHAAELYARSKVGINLHGPSQYGVGNAQRLYDLTVCGVAVVTDGAGFGMNEIFEPDEVMSYLWSNFDEMTAQVKYLLDNPEVRISQATKARERTKKDYRNDVAWMTRGVNTAIKFWKQTGLWK
jgi:glycosyltransferase involved in cell wall biosynthesis